MNEQLFDKIAEAGLSALESKLMDVDPDDLDVELTMGVLTLTFSDGAKLIVNSHRAARQIWMAAFRQAWHFSPVENNGGYAWKTEKDELRATLTKVLSEKLARPVRL